MKPMQFYGEFEDEVGHYLVECGLFCSSSMKIKSKKIIIYLCSGWIRYCQTFHILTKSFQYNFAPTTIPLVDNYNINRLSQAQPPPSFETARIYWSVSPDSYTSTQRELNKSWQQELPERGGKGSEHFPRQKSGREIPHLPPSMDSDICRGKYNEPSLTQEVKLADQRRSI